MNQTFRFKRLLFWLSFIVLFVFGSYRSYAQTDPQLIHSVPDFQINEDSVFRYIIPDSVFSDPDPNKNLITAISAFAGELLPGWSYGITSGIEGIPLQSDTGVYFLIAEAYYPNGVISRDTFSITVLHVNDPPLIVKTISNQLKYEGYGTAQFNIDELFFDEEGSVLSYEINVSSNSVVSASLSGTLLTLNEIGTGEAEVEILASDESSTTSFHFLITTIPQSEVLGFKTQNTGSNGLVDSNISALMEDTGGAIWIATNNAISQFNDGIWTSYEFDEVVDGAYSSIWQTLNGQYYFISYSGIRVYNGVEWSFISSGNTQVLPTYILNSYVDDNNVLWIVGYDDGTNYNLIKNDGTGWQRVTSVFLADSPSVYSMLYQEGKSKLWLGAWDKLITVENGTISEFTGTGESFNYVKGISIDSTNKVWFITSTGTYREEGSSFTNVYQVGGEVFASLRNDLWVLSGNNGQFFLNVTSGTERFIEVPVIKDEFGRMIYMNFTDVLEASDGSIWIGTDFGLLHTQDIGFPMSSMEIINTLDGLVSNDVRKILQANNYTYWLNTDKGTTRYDGKNWTYYGKYLQVKLKDSQGRLWFREGAIFNSGIDSVSYLKDGNWMKFTTAEIGLNQITDIKEGADSSIWVSAYVGGISKYNGANWTNYNISDGLLSEAVTTILVDSKNNLWVVYGDFDLGISKFDGTDWVHYSVANGLSDNAINYIMEDDKGAIWLSTVNNGISIYDNGNWRYMGFVAGSDSLKANYVQKTIVDVTGSIWIIYDWTSGLGISRLIDNRLEHYTVEDGLLTNNVKDFIQQYVISSGGTLTEQKTLFWATGKGLGQFTVEALNAGTQPPDNIVTGINDEQLNIFVYPNPIKDILHIKVKDLKGESVLIRITDLQGKSFIETIVSTQAISRELRINVQNLPVGIYLIELHNKSANLKYKILKK